MPGFIRDKAKKASAKPARGAHDKPIKPSPKSTTPQHTSAKAVSSNEEASPASKLGSKRSHQESNTAVSSPIAKKARPSNPASKVSLPNFPPRESTIPATLPANAHDYLHDASGVLPSLLESYNVTTMQIISSSKMSAKIARTLDALLKTIDFANPKAKPGLVMLYAKAPVAGKLVSVVEVVKREIAARGKGGDRGGVWFQYSVLVEGVKVLPRKKEGEGDAVEVDEEGMDDGGIDERVFETMKTKKERMIEGTDKIRAGPVMTVYLSRVRIEKLKNAYGEQTNSTK